jgi:hypothetical protein
MRIFLNFVPRQNAVERARLSYAFRLYCAIYGHQPIFNGPEAASADVWISYSAPRTNESHPTVQLANLFRARDVREPAPAPRPFAVDDQTTVLVHECPEGTTPDWLGEIFEWVSCADEYSVSQRDFAGRIPFRKTYAGRHHLNIRLPYAAIAMRLLQREIVKLIPKAGANPLLPVPGYSHFIVNTHDVDFLPLERLHSVRRLAKNLGISLLYYRSPQLALRQLWKLLSLLAGGTDPFDQVARLAELEARDSITASYFFIPTRKHPRDANYSLSTPGVADILRYVEHMGMETGVHGSYTSLDATPGLVSEFEDMRKQGFTPAGGRQHWLRFTPDQLISGLEASNAVYDTSLGWSDRVGFRAGACFAFPPYNFEREAAATFLEMPLAIMDQGLIHSQRNALDTAVELLATSRRYGWGGISLLWHPAAFNGVQYPEEIGSVFWQLVNHRFQWSDTWLRSLDFVEVVRPRYESAGFTLNTIATNSCVGAQ